MTREELLRALDHGLDRGGFSARAGAANIIAKAGYELVPTAGGIYTSEEVIGYERLAAADERKRCVDIVREMIVLSGGFEIRNMAYEKAAQAIEAES